MDNDFITVLIVLISILALLGLFLLIKYLGQIGSTVGFNKAQKLQIKSGCEYYLSIVSQATIAIKLPNKYAYCLSIHKENLLDKLFKLTGISCEFQCNDKEFDQEYYIDSEDYKFCRMLFASEKARDIIKKIFTLNIKYLSTDDNMLWVNCKSNHKPSEEKIETIVSNLYFLLEIIEQLDCSANNANLAKKWRSIIKVSWRFYLTAIGIDIYIIFFGNLIAEELFKHSLEYSLPTALLASLIVIKTFFRSSKSHKAIKYSLLILLPSIAIFIYDAMYVLNIALDSSRETVYTVQVIDKESHRGRKYGRSYQIRTTPFLSEHDQYTLQDSRELYHCLNIGDEVRLIVKDGYLGFRWIKSEELVKQCN